MAYPPIDLSDLPDKYDPKKHAVIDLSDLPDQKDKILEEAKKSLDSKDVETEPKKQEPSFLSKAWHAVSDPLTDAPSRFAKTVADYVNPPNVGVQDPRAAFGAGAIEGVGHLVSSMTSPLNLALTALSGGEYGAAKAGLPEIANMLRTGTRALSVPFAAHGGYEAVRPDASLGERAQGLAELAGGAAGMIHSPNTAKPEPTANLETIAKDTIDPNFNGGEGNPEYAGYTPYKQTNPALDNIQRNAPYGEGSIMPSTTLPTEMRGEMVPQDDFPPINFREDRMPPPSPDLTPVGQEEDYNSMFGMSGRKPLKDLQYELAQNKFGMGKELPPSEQKPFEGDMGDDLRKIFDEAPEINLPSGYEPVGANKFNKANAIDADFTSEPKKSVTYENGKPGGITVHYDEEPVNGAIPATRNDTGMVQYLRPQDIKLIEDTHNRIGKNKAIDLTDLPHPTEESVPHDVEPTAKFLALSEDGKPLYNIEGGPRDKSTVTADTLQQEGIQVPETPSDAKPMKGSELRELALKARQSTANDAPLSAPGNGGTPQFNPRGQNGLTGQLQQIGKDIVDPATGEVIPPKVDLGGKPPTEPPINNGGSGGNNGGAPKEPVNPDLTPEGKKPSTLSEILNTPRALQIGNLHLSAPLRQGLPLITTKSWWTSWNDMFKAFGSQAASDAIEAQIKSHPNFQPSISSRTGKELPSFAEKSGLSLTNDLTKREEVLGSKWLENIPGYKASNRAFRTYLNKLRSDTFNSLIEDATKSGLNPKQDLSLSKDIANFVNNATGRGSLGGLAKHAELLNNTLFAPRKIAGNIQMLNPANYITGNPFVRKQYLKAMLSTAGAWTTFAGLAKAAGAEVSLDPNNADFGKIKIGNTRLDPAGGFQQYLVAGARLLSNSYTSSTTGKSSELGGKFGSSTRKDIVENFASNKLNTPFKFAYDLLNASKGRPYNISDQAARMFIPIVAQDIIELAKEDPRLLPTAIPAMFGMGEQTYGRKGAKQTVIPKALSVNIH